MWLCKVNARQELAKVDSFRLTEIFVQRRVFGGGGRADGGWCFSVWQRRGVEEKGRRGEEEEEEERNSHGSLQQNNSKTIGIG